MGLAPGVGEWADALNSAWYLHEGRLVESVLSASATVPGLGIGATVSKWFGRTDRISNADDLIEATQFSELTLEPSTRCDETVWVSSLKLRRHNCGWRGNCGLKLLPG